MASRPGAAVLLALLALGAGCEGVLPTAPGATPTAAPDTATSAPVVGTPTPIATAASPPPGLTAGGVTAPERLAEAHRRTLSEHSYTMRYLLAAIDDGRRIGCFTARARVAAGPAAFSYASETSGVFRAPAEPHRQRIWGNRSTLLHAETLGEVTRHDRFGPSMRDDVERIVTRRELVAFAFVLVDTEVVAVEREEGAILYRLASTDGPHALDGEDVTLSATVEASGLVRSLTLAYRTDDFGAGTRVVRRLRFEDVDATTVPRPGWVDRVPRNAS